MTLKPTAKQTKPCPICGKPAKERSTPFCSERCRNLDLHRWFTGSYAAPAEEEDNWDGEDKSDKTEDNR